MLLLGFDKLKKFAISCALLGSVSVLPGCDNSTSSNKTQSTATVKADSTKEIEQRKFNLYVKAYNGLLDNTFGLVGSANTYGKMKLDTPKPAGIYHSPTSSSFYTEAMDNLKEGRALSAPSSADADAAADALLKTLPVVITRIDEIAPYYNGGAYLQDNLAKGKAQDPVIREAFQNAMQSLGMMNEALSAYQRRAQADEAEAYRKEGNMPVYYSLTSLMLGTDMVNAINEKDVEKADIIVPKLEASLENLHRALVDLKDPREQGSMSSLHDALIQSIGFMRQYKSDKQESSINAMMSSYNFAVQAANNLN
jgi:hypothetical protein